MKKQNRQIKFYVNDDEYLQAKINAEKVGLTINQYAKKLAVNVNHIESKTDQEFYQEIQKYNQELVKLKAQLRKIGSNVNQIAKSKNLEIYYSGKSRDEVDIFRMPNSNLDIKDEVKIFDAKVVLQKVADELKNIRLALENLKENEKKKKGE